MAYCLNPDCPHKKKTGRPAEFREGFTHCSDCGSLLTEVVIEKEEPHKAPPRPIPAHLYRRILYTVGLVLLWRAVLFIPIPGIDFEIFRFFFKDETTLGMLLDYAHSLQRVSVLAHSPSFLI